MENEKEIALAQNEFSMASEQVAALAASQSALVPYVPKSKATFKMETLIPRNMAFEIQKSLNFIVNRHGNIDSYVRNGLKYPTTAKMWDALSAEQVDGVALYLNQFDNEQGIIIADQTGIGKGRQAAAVILHAVRNGYLPVFFTKSPNLFTDIYRDLKAIGFDSINPFIVNTTSDAKIKDAYGNVMYSPLSSDAQSALITEEIEFPTESPESIAWHQKIGKMLPDPEKIPTIKISQTIDYLPTGYDMIFSTYSQIQSAHPYKRTWLENLVASAIEGSRKYKKVVFILDESHMAGGFESIIGKWMRGVLPQTKACCFLSATFAKYPEVMPFYAKKTAIAETGLDDEKFVGAMTRGGLALQEIVASNLCESGQLIRRQRSNKGIKVAYIELNKEPQRSKHRQSVNTIISLMNEIVKFERDYIIPILGEIHAETKKQGKKLESKPRGLGVKQSPYFSRVFNIVDQMLFALKVDAVVKQTIKLLKEDKKVVIAFKSTMGTFLKDLNLVSGDIVAPEDLDFSRTLIKGLENIFKYNHVTIYGERIKRQIPLHELPQNGIEKYHAIRERILLESSGLNISPIDQLIHKIQSERKPKDLGGHDNTHFSVAEVTGRNQRIDFSDGEAVVESFRSNSEKSFRLFNSGHYDVLLINQSGSTGASAHSSKDFKDQRQRAMLIHQFELDINIEVQKRGRINRTGQVNLPEYYYITSDIPTERRLMTMLKGKLKSLDANTTGSQKTNDGTLKSADFFNKYGDIAAWNWVDENRNMLEKLGHPTYHKKIKSNGDSVYERNDSKDGAIRQLTGRAGLLMVEEQDKLFDDLLSRYDHQIKLAQQQGTYDLETEFLQLDAQVKKRFLYREGTGGVTPFGKNTIRDVCIVNNLNRPFTKQEIDRRITEALEGEKPSQVRLKLAKEIDAAFTDLIATRKEKRLKKIEKLKSERDLLPKRGSAETEKENKKIIASWNKLEKLISDKTSSLGTYIATLENSQKTIIRYINMWNIGDVVRIPPTGSELLPSWGIFLGVHIRKSASNPYTYSNISVNFGVTNSRKTISYSLLPAEQLYISQIALESKDISEQDIQMVQIDWNSLIKKASAKRTRRQILTENIVGVASEIGSKNKLIKYNTNDGVIKSGILLHKSFGKDQEDNFTILPISKAYQIISQLEIENFFVDQSLGFRIKRVSSNYYQVYITKKKLYKAIIDPKLRGLLKREPELSIDELPEFVQNAGEMTAALHIDNLQQFLRQLDQYGLNYLGKARPLEDWEIENENDWKSKTKKVAGQYTYALGSPYGQGSNPTSGFTSYQEPTVDYKHGIVMYNRKLSDKEKYNFSLIPIFKNVEQPYKEWKEAILQTKLKNEFTAVVTKASRLSLHKAIDRLGYFIFNNSHEDGNPEFVFGKYSPQDLGRIFYEDTIAEISAIDELINQLQIELQQ